MKSVKGVKREVAINEKDIIFLFFFSLLTFYLESLAWPLHPGRDLETYLSYYVEFWKEVPVLHYNMVLRTPVAPMLIGWINGLGGSFLLEFFQGLLYAISIVLVYSIGINWGRYVGLSSGIVLIFYPPFAFLYHNVSSECFFSFGIILWSWWVMKTMANPSLLRFVFCGVGISLIALVRPAGQMLLLFCLAPVFLLKLGFGHRLKLSLAVILPGLLILVMWSTHNYIRYDDFTVARGSNATMPLYRLWVLNRIVQPENGPASALLAKAVREDLLPREPYLSHGITEKQFFNSGSNRIWSDLHGLSDRVWGWSSDHHQLWLVSMEALKSHGNIYLKNLLLDFQWLLSMPLGFPEITRPNQRENPSPPKMINQNGKMSPIPTKEEPIPNAYFFYLQTNPSNQRRSSTDLNKLRDEIKALGLDIPTRNGSSLIATLLRKITTLWPPMLTFLLMGCLGFFLKPPDLSYPLLILVVLALINVFGTLIGLNAVPQYRIPFDPLFILFGILGLLQAGQVIKRGNKLNKVN